MVGHRPAFQYELFSYRTEPPQTRFREELREIHERVDWEALRDIVAPYFAERGAPSCDPVVMVKMQLLGYLFGITSDRRLVEECLDRLSFREFLGYLPDDDDLPNHGSFTNWRKRLGEQVYTDLLHEVVRQIQAQLGWSTARAVDATSVKAQAGRGGPVLEVPEGADVAAYVAAYYAGEVAGEERGAGTVAVNLHDPEARLQRKTGEQAEFRYKASFSTDVETGVVCDATATAVEVARTAVEHVQADPGGLVEELVADTLYDHGPTLTALAEAGVTCYVPQARRERAGRFSREQFAYEAATDTYVCPAGKVLRHHRYDVKKRQHFYVARVTDCRACPLKVWCTSGQKREVSRLEDQAGRDQAVRGGADYAYLMRRRRVLEHLWFLAKRDHGLSRARALGLAAMKIQACLTALALNLKRWVRGRLRAWGMGVGRACTEGVAMANTGRQASPSWAVRWGRAAPAR